MYEVLVHAVKKVDEDVADLMQFELSSFSLAILMKGV